MDSIQSFEGIDRGRRQLLGAAGIGIAVAGVAGLLPLGLAAATAGDGIRPYRINVPEKDLVDLRRRIAATRWPDRETVNDESQGARLAKFQELVRYWGTNYDWRKVEGRLNALPQFMTTIDGVDIHFIHARSRHPNALPVIISHGWPGSIIEQLKIVGPLTDPTAQGDRAEDAFDVVIPSLPGYGFSGKPTSPGWDPDRIARAWAELMKRLGYTRYVAQGGDWGAPISSAMARQGAVGLLGIHINLPGTGAARGGSGARWRTRAGRNVRERTRGARGPQGERNEREFSLLHDNDCATANNRLRRNGLARGLGSVDSRASGLRAVDVWQRSQRVPDERRRAG